MPDKNDRTRTKPQETATMNPKPSNQLPMQDDLQGYEPLKDAGVWESIWLCFQTLAIVTALLVMLLLEWCGLLKDPVTNGVNELFAPRFKWPDKIKRAAGKFPPFLAKLRYRFDLGSGFFAIANFALLVIAAGDKLALIVHVSVTVIALVLVPLAIFSVWLLGYILDKMRFAQAYTEEVNKRNEMLKDVHDRLQIPIDPSK